MAYDKDICHFDIFPRVLHFLCGLNVITEIQQSSSCCMGYSGFSGSLSVHQLASGGIGYPYVGISRARFLCKFTCHSHFTIFCSILLKLVVISREAYIRQYSFMCCVWIIWLSLKLYIWLMLYWYQVLQYHLDRWASLFRCFFLKGWVSVMFSWWKRVHMNLNVVFHSENCVKLQADVCRYKWF